MDELNEGLQQPQDEKIMQESQGQGEIMQESNELRSNMTSPQRQPYGSLAAAQEVYGEREMDVMDERPVLESTPAAAQEVYGEREMDVMDERPVLESTSNTRQVKIERLSSGFLVTVGCQRVAIESTKKLTAMLAKYYENPRDFEKKWFSNDIVNRLDNIN
jgi:hypothetical protein